MNIKIHSSELNRMMKTISQCLDPKDQNKSNVEITYDENKLIIRGTNGQLFASMSTPILGGDGESFCIDGALFARVCSMCAGDVEISTDGKTCTIKGVGRTRIPIVDANIPAFDSIKSTASICMKASSFQTAYNGIAHAISTDQSRIVLTGARIESHDGTASMVALDGFRLAYETMPCESGKKEIDAIIPGNFMKLLRDSVGAGDDITLSTDGKKIKAETDGMMIGCPLLNGSFPDIQKVVPKEFTTDVLLKADYFRSALKSNGIVCTSNNLVKFVIDDDKLTISGNSEQAEYSAEIECNKTGKDLKIAFNQRFLLETINSIPSNDIVMHFNTPINPCVINAVSNDGYRLVLPVRVMG